MGAVELSHRFLLPAWLTCEACGGRRFRAESLAVRLPLDGRSFDIADVFGLSVGEARELLREDPRLDADPGARSPRSASTT